MDYKVIHSLDNESVMLISEEIGTTEQTLYQVIRGGSVELNTLDRTEAVRLYKKFARELINLMKEELQHI